MVVKMSVVLSWVVMPSFVGSDHCFKEYISSKGLNQSNQKSDDADIQGFGTMQTHW